MQNSIDGKALLDLGYLKEMVGENPDFMIEILDVFTEQTPIYLAELDKALEEGNWEKVGNSAHKIKPTFSYIGRDDLKDFVQVIEQNARNNKDIEEIPNKIAELKGYLEIVYQQIATTKAKLLNDK